MDKTIDFDLTETLSQTKDSLIIQTENLINDLLVLQNFWRSLVDIIDDPYIDAGKLIERYIVCFGKWNFLEQCRAA